MGFLVKTQNCFGLDISDLSLKIAQLKQSGKTLRLASFGSALIPAGVIEDSKVRDENSLAKIIKKAIADIKGEKIKTRYVVSSLPEEKSFLDIFQLPQLKEEELEDAVRFEAENHIPMGIDDVYFDFEKVPFSNQSGGKTQEMLVAAAPKEIVDSYLSALKSAGLQPKAIEVECLAIARSVVRKGVSKRPLLIIDFGETRTSFMIFSGHSLRFTSTIPISSKALTESISRGLKVGFKQAEELKYKEGLTGKKQVLSAMAPSLTDLSFQIKTHLKYYHSHSSKSQAIHNGKNLDKILLCGGGTNLKGLPEFLASSLNMSVELANPWINILKEPLREVPQLPFKKSLSYTTALGLALRGISL